MQDTFKIGPFIVRPTLNTLERDGDVHRLSHKAMQVLLCLAAEPGEVLSKNALIEKVWEGSFTSDEALSTVIYELRRAFGDKARDPRYIETIRKSGYRLIARVDLNSIASTASSGEPPPESAKAPLVESTVKVDVPQPRSRPRVFLLVVLAGFCVLAGFWLLPKTEKIADEGEIRSLVVLPLATQSREPDFFAQGLTTMLTADLAERGSIDILSGLTTLSKADDLQIPAAEELTADAVLEGLVQRSGDRLWLSVKLVDSLTGRVLWGGTYERQVGDELVLQRELALEIGQQIRRRLETAPQSRLASVDPLDPKAAEAFHLGQYFLDQRTPQGHEKALQYFQMAIELEPEFAPAHVGLANTYLATAEDLPAPSQGAVLEKAKAAAETALALDTDLPEAHLSRASVFFQHEWDWRNAEEHFELGYEPNACAVEDGYHYARYLSAMGRHEEAVQAVQLCLDREPASKLGRWTLAWVHYMARRYDEALSALSMVEELDPDFAPMCRLQGDVFLAKGDENSAFAAQRRLMELTGASEAELGELEQAFAEEGMDGAFGWLLSAAAKGAESAEDPVRLAALQARRGEVDDALGSLERAFDARHGDLVWIQVDPAFDTLRQRPRFQALLDRLDLDLTPSQRATFETSSKNSKP